MLKARNMRYLVTLLLLGSCTFLLWRRGQVAHAHGIWVYVSQTCGPLDQSDDRTVVLSIRANGDTYLNQDFVPWPELSSRLETIFATRWERVLRVTAEDDVNFGQIVDIINNAKVHVSHLAIVMIPGGKPEDAMNRWCINYGDILPQDRYVTGWDGSLKGN